MKLSDHTEHIRKLIDSAFRNRLGRMGITINRYTAVEDVSTEYRADRERVETIRELFIEETGGIAEAYEKLVEEFTFTLFNRLAALKVMEAHTLHAEIVTRRSQHGDRSFAHKDWLEKNPEGRNEEMEGLVRFLEDQLDALAADIPLFSPQHPYHLLPTAIELSGIMNAFNQVETDTQVEDAIWQSDDVLGWLYESYNSTKKQEHKDSDEKTEYNKVSIQSQVYTPRWVVKFLVDNSLGKLYLEMYPDSEIKNRYKIANAPKIRTREPKQLTELRMIDPATGSGNYLLYGFDLFYDLYTDQVENYGADYDDRKIAELILANNLYGVDLDDRAIQLAQLGLYIKVKRKKRSAKIEHFNIVSSDFYLPAYATVKHIFEENAELDEKERNIIADLWEDLQNAHKFGALIRLEEKLNIKWFGSNKQIDQHQIAMFGQANLEDYEKFKKHFFKNLQKAVAQNTAKQGQTFLNTKTQDAITFLKLLTQKYDIAVANPPYTENKTYGPQLKKFLLKNYKDYSTNLYGVFLIRCLELVDAEGKIALIHPMTFMYLNSFVELREKIINHSSIELFVEYGLSNLFGEVMADPCMYVISNKVDETQDSLFISLDQYTRTPLEARKKYFLDTTIDNLISSKEDKHLYKINQLRFKKVTDSPFLYNLSDSFIKQFSKGSVSGSFKICPGIVSADNQMFLRLWWEIGEKYSKTKDWPLYAKGGRYNKWAGNLWATINWKDNGMSIKNLKNSEGKKVTRTPNEEYYFQEGLTYTAKGSKGVSYRILPEGSLFDVGGTAVFPLDDKISIEYACAFFNSTLSTFISDKLNPTVTVNQSDVERIPFVFPEDNIRAIVESIAKINIEIKLRLLENNLIEPSFNSSPISYYFDSILRERILNFLNYENAQLALLLVNESIINQYILDVYELVDEDKLQVESKIGRPIGGMPLTETAKSAFLSEYLPELEVVREHIQNLPKIEFEEQKIHTIKSEFASLYKGNNDLEEFCIRHQVNPINVWFLFKQSKTLPQARASEITLEFLGDSFRNILMQDEDGIVPLVGLPGEPRLMDRFEEYCFSKGFTSAQIMQLDALIGRPINEYVEYYFFKNLSDHLNLFMYLPKTPFIWHLSSGEHQGFEAYIIIYKWNRDSLYKLKSSYLSKRTESLQYRLQQIADSTTGQAQTEKETIRRQLQEIEAFAKKIDELIAEGYDPKLDDGVGKNIAPLQAKGMLKAEVLKASGKNSQLQKYLNADW